MTTLTGTQCRAERERFGLSIKKLSKRTGVCTDQIRFLEASGLDEPEELMWPGTEMRLAGFFEDAQLEFDMEEALRVK